MAKNKKDNAGGTPAEIEVEIPVDHVADAAERADADEPELSTVMQNDGPADNDGFAKPAGRLYSVSCPGNESKYVVADNDDDAIEKYKVASGILATEHCITATVVAEE